MRLGLRLFLGFFLIVARLVGQSQAPVKKDAQTVEFPVKVAADGEATVTYRDHATQDTLAHLAADERRGSRVALTAAISASFQRNVVLPVQG